MKLLMNLSDQLALARVCGGGHGRVQGLLAAHQNDLLLGSGDSCVQEIAAQDFVHFGGSITITVSYCEP